MNHWVKAWNIVPSVLGDEGLSPKGGTQSQGCPRTPKNVDTAKVVAIILLVSGL